MVNVWVASFQMKGIVAKASLSPAAAKLMASCFKAVADL
jgi:hypothetical protein